MALAKSNKLPATHPGIIFKQRVLDMYSISVTQAAERLHMSRKQVSSFANGKSDVSVLLAKKLELSTGISAGFWLNLQKTYDLHKASNMQVEAEPMYAFD